MVRRGCPWQRWAGSNNRIMFASFSLNPKTWQVQSTSMNGERDFIRNQTGSQASGMNHVASVNETDGNVETSGKVGL